MQPFASPRNAPQDLIAEHFESFVCEMLGIVAYQTGPWQLKDTNERVGASLSVTVVPTRICAGYDRRLRGVRYKTTQTQSFTRQRH